jgi:hypothetical protein
LICHQHVAPLSIRESQIAVPNIPSGSPGSFRTQHHNASDILLACDTLETVTHGSILRDLAIRWGRATQQYRRLETSPPRLLHRRTSCSLRQRMRTWSSCETRSAHHDVRPLYLALLAIERHVLSCIVSKMIFLCDTSHCQYLCTSRFAPFAGLSNTCGFISYFHVILVSCI